MPESRLVRFFYVPYNAPARPLSANLKLPSRRLLAIMPRKVIIGADPGIDDAVAITLALFDPELEVVAVTATGGNIFPSQATKNVQTMIQQLDPTRRPRIGGHPD